MGDPDEVAHLVAYLRLRPDSTYRATVFTRDPPPAGEGGLGWYGFSQDTALLLGILNTLASKRKMHGPPTAADEPRWEQPPQSEIEMLQALRRPQGNN